MNLCGNPFFLSKKAEKEILSKVETMTDREKIGQLFCPDAGKYSYEELYTLVHEYGIGGILLRPDDEIVISDKLKYVDSCAKIPLLHAANLECGGNGAYKQGTNFANPMGVAAANDMKITQKFSKVCAYEGKKVGINWALSPVADINFNPLNPIVNVRSFGDDVNVVAKNSVTFVKNLQQFGIAACAKHFPGDGVDFRDQHLHPTYNNLSALKWYNTYGKVYKHLIKAGVQTIMVGHICQPAVTMKKNRKLEFCDVMPASLCKELVSDVLRKEFNFNGVITTDATVMGGYYQAGDRKSMLPLSIEIGCDILLFNKNFYEDFNAVENGLKSGNLSRQRLDEAVTRILALKYKIGINDKLLTKVNVQSWKQECADRSITLVKNNGGILPLNPNNKKEIKIGVFGEEKISDEFIFDIADKYLSLNGFSVTKYDKKEDIETNCPVILFSMYQPSSGKSSIRLDFAKAPIKSEYISKQNNIFISLGYPYHLIDIPRIKTYINAYTPDRETIISALSKVIGKSEFKGESPVDAFCGMEDTKL